MPRRSPRWDANAAFSISQKTTRTRPAYFFEVSVFVVLVSVFFLPFFFFFEVSVVLLVSSAANATTALPITSDRPNMMVMSFFMDLEFLLRFRPTETSVVVIKNGMGT
jgi:hypothetical protein